MKKADIIRGEPVAALKMSVLAKRMECNETVIRKIAELSGGIHNRKRYSMLLF
jgi:hypothetical protein